MDLAIYAKAQEIVWKQPGEFVDVDLRMGAFHTAMTFIAVIGKRFGDGGSRGSPNRKRHCGSWFDVWGS